MVRLWIHSPSLCLLLILVFFCSSIGAPWEGLCLIWESLRVIYFSFRRSIIWLKTSVFIPKELEPLWEDLEEFWSILGFVSTTWVRENHHSSLARKTILCNPTICLIGHCVRDLFHYDMLSKRILSHILNIIGLCVQWMLPYKHFGRHRKTLKK